MKKFMALLLAFMTLLTMAGCASSQAGSSLPASGGGSGASPQAAEKSSGPITITDMLGRQVTVNGPVRRVVVDQWSTAEVLMTVGGEEIVDTLQGVGNTKSSEIVKKLYSEQYPRLAQMPNIGGGKGSTHDVEMIISLKPDVFIINSSGSFLDNAQETVDKLEKAGIPSVVLTMAENPMASPQEGIALVGKLFGCEQRAGEIIDYIDAQFNLIRSKKLSERQNKPTVYQEKGFGTSEEYDVTSTSDGWASIIELTGGENIAKNAIGASGIIDPEYLIASDPDFIIITGALGFGEDKDKGTQVIDEYIKRAGWDTLKAVKGNVVYELPHGHARDQMCFYPSLFLAKLFYPDDFADIDPAGILKEFFDRFMLVDYEGGVWSAHRETPVNG